MKAKFGDHLHNEVSYKIEVVHSIKIKTTRKTKTIWNQVESITSQAP